MELSRYSPHPSLTQPSTCAVARQYAHRTGEGWSKSAILDNPRYTGRQVWKRQRKQEVLRDVENVADGYETKFKWNERDKWIFSDQVAHESLVSVEDFERAQQIRAAAGRGRDTRERIKVERTYVLRGLVRCGLCGRKMQAQHNNDRAFYRCRYAQEYALANHVKHPLNVYLKEKDVLPALDGWLGKLFGPHRIDETVRAKVSSQDASPSSGTDPAGADVERRLADCDMKRRKYRAALEAGTDPETVGEWIAEVKAERAAINAEVKTQMTDGQNDPRLDETEIKAMIKALGDIRPVIRAAEPADKAKVYKELGLELTYEPGKHIIRAQVILGPDIRGVIGSVRVPSYYLRERNFTLPTEVIRLDPLAPEPARPAT